MAAQVGSLYVSMTVNAQPYMVGMGRVQDATRRAAGQIRKDVGVAQTSVNTFARSVGSRHAMRPYAIIAASRAFETATDRSNLLRGSMLALTAVAGGFAAALSSNLVLRYADSFTALHNSMRVVTEDSADLSARFAAVKDIADRSRASLQGTAVLYSRLQKASPGRSVEEILRATETIQKALTLGGATTQEAYSTAIQLSQGLASNRLGGEELRAVLETPLGLELARGLGVTIGKFREMGHAGELTADMLFTSLGKISDRIDTQFSKSVRTLDQSFTILDNRLIDYIGSTNEAYGVTQALGSGVIALSENLDTVIPLIAGVAGLLGTVFAARVLGSGANRVASYFGQFGAAARAARQEIKDLDRSLRTLQTERRGLINQIVNQRAAVFDAGAAVKSVIGARGAPTQKQIEAVAAAEKKVAELSKQRADQETRLVSARAQAVSAAQRDVDLAREAVRAGQGRISQVQERIAAEQRAIADRADKDVAARVGAVRKSQEQIAAIDQKIVMERSRLEEQAAKRSADARTKLDKAASDARINLAKKEAAVINAAERERRARAQVADIRSAQSLPDFQKVFGKEYEKAIRDQGRAIVANQKATADLADAKMRAVEAERALASVAPVTAEASKRLEALERSRVALLGGLAEAQARVTAAEKLAADARSGLVSSSKLQGLLRSEGKAINDYGKEIERLRAASAKLRDVTAGNITIPGVAKAVKDLDAVDDRLRKAEASMDAARRAMDEAGRTMNKGAFNKAASDFKTAGDELVRLRTTLIGVNGEIAKVVPQMAAASKVAYGFGLAGMFARRAFFDLVGLLGGPVGVALTAAVIGFSMLGAAAAKEAQRVQNARRLIDESLQRLGEVETPIDGAKETALGRRYKETLDELREIEKRSADARQAIADVLALPARLPVGQTTFRRLTDELGTVTEQFLNGQVSIVDYRNEVDRLKNELPTDAFKAFSDGVLQNALDVVGADMAAKEYAKTLAELEDRLAFRNAGGFVEQIMEDERRLKDAREAYARGQDLLGERTRRAGLSAGDRELEDLTNDILEQVEKVAKASDKTINVTRAQATAQAELEIATKKANEAREEEAKANEKLAQGYIDIGKRRAEELELLGLIGDARKQRGYEIEYINEEVRAGAELTAELEARAKQYASVRIAMESAAQAQEDEIERQKRLKEAIADIELGPLIDKMQDLDVRVLEAGKSVGATREEIKTFVEAAARGDVKNIPAIFRGIRDAMIEVESISFNGTIEGIKRLQAEMESMRNLEKMYQKEIDKYVKSAEQEIRVNELRAQGKELEARIEAEYFRLVEQGVKITREQVAATEESRMIAEKKAEAYAKSSRELSKENKELDKTANIIAKLKREGDAAFFGEVDRAVIQNLRNIKDAETELRSYIAAVQSGDFSGVPQDIMDVRAAEVAKQAAESYRDLIMVYGTGGQLAGIFAEKQEILNYLVDNGMISAQQAGEVWADFVSQFRGFEWIDQTANAFGEFAKSAIMDFKNIEEAALSFVNRLLEIALQVMILEPLIRSLRSAMAGVTGSGGGIISFITAILGGGGSPLPAAGFGRLYHGGGRAGGAGSGMRAVSPLVFAGAPRLHSGLTSSEFAAILQKGEHVLTDRMAGRTAATIDGLSKAAANSNVGGGGLTIIEAPGAHVGETRQTEDGGMEVVLTRMIDDRIADSVHGRGSAGRAMESMYGLSRSSGLKRKRKN